MGIMLWSDSLAKWLVVPDVYTYQQHTLSNHTSFGAEPPPTILSTLEWILSYRRYICCTYRCCNINTYHRHEMGVNTQSVWWIEVVDACLQIRCGKRNFYTLLSIRYYIRCQENPTTLLPGSCQRFPEVMAQTSIFWALVEAHIIFVPSHPEIMALGGIKTLTI